MSLLEHVTKKILDSYDTEPEIAERYAKDLIAQIERLGGNPEVEEQIDRSIEIVIKKWIEKGY